MSLSNTEYFNKLGERFAQAQDELLAQHDVKAGARARLLNAVPRSSAAPSWRWALAPALAAAALVVVLLGRWSSEPAALSFDVGQSHGEAGQLVTAARASVPLRFSDGSLLEVTPQAQSRVLSVTPHGARVELQRGALQASVVHRPDTTWAVLAGPFQVAVTGTRFVTRWNPLTHELEVTVQEGSVLVSGGTLRTPERVVAGKTLHVSLAPSAEPGLSVSTESASPAPAAPAAPVDGSQPVRAHAAGSAHPAFEAVFETGSPTDLVTLSQELRHRGDLRGATRALLALRTRFPSDPRSLLAAQSLTELALARHDCSEARRWWAAYVPHAPAGTARGALGQRVEACSAR